MKRCREGQIIACIRSNEMVARLQREAMKNKWSNEIFKTKNHEPVILLYIQRSQESPTFHSICRGPEIPPTNRSIIARFRMSRYARRRWSWRCLANTMIVKKLKMTMNRDSVVIRTTHGMQAGAEEESRGLSRLNVVTSIGTHSSSKCLPQRKPDLEIHKEWRVGEKQLPTF